MFELKLCETQEYLPPSMEHWLSGLQAKKTPTHFLLKEEGGKVKILCSENLESHFFGSRSEATAHSQIPTKKALYIHQAKGPLLPIKRPSQFENSLDRERLYPLNLLIYELSKLPGSFVEFQFKAVPDKTRERLLEKAKQPWYKATHWLDQWESRAWLHWRLRNLILPFIRKLRSQKTPVKGGEEHTQGRHEREEPRAAVLDKLSRPLFQVEISLSHPFSSFFESFNVPYLGTLRVSKKPAKILLSNEELGGLLSPPQMQISSRYLHTESTAYLPAPNPPPLITIEDRKRHHLVLGKTGMGKSTLLLKNIERDIQEGHCVVVMEPHGDLIDHILERLGPAEQSRLILVDPSVQEYPLALNPLEVSARSSPIQKAGALIDFFKAIYGTSWGPRLEYLLRNSILTLLLLPNTTLLDIPRLLTDCDFLLSKLSNLKDLELQRFWRDEFLALPVKLRQEHAAPLLNKVGPLLVSPILRNILGQPKSKLKLEACLNPGQILLIRLSKADLGQEGSKLIGMILLSLIEDELFLRGKLPQEQRSLVSLVVDEAHHFANQRLATLLSEARKFGLAMTLAHQYLDQLPPELQSAVLGNVGTLTLFRSSFEDAERLASTLGLQEQDLTHLAPFESYVKMLSQGRLLPIFRESVCKTQPVEAQEMQALKVHWEQKLGRKLSLIEEKMQNRYNKNTPLSKNDASTRKIILTT